MKLEHCIKSEDGIIKISFETITFIDEWKSGLIKIKNVEVLED